MGAPLSEVIENSFEQILSSDVNRLQRLADREIQDLWRDYGADGAGLPISGVVGAAPTLTPIAASFTETLSAGRGFFSSPVGVGPDDSSFQVLRWDSQVVAFGAPAGNPRIDLVVATPGIVSADSVSRNILTDPVLRTVAPVNVFKTQNPLSVITVVAGAPAATPVPPAVPAGAVALFEVYVPVAAIDSNDFMPVPRLFRLVTGAHARLTGILGGASLTWNQLIGDQKPYLTSEVCKVLIDGELIEFTALGVFGSTTGDGGADPFTTANPSATAARPFYVYAVGGRASPQGTFQPALPAGIPIALVCSLVAPDIRTGKPSAPITPPRGGATTSACYLGLGFTYPTSIDPFGLQSQACLSDGGWVAGGIVAFEAKANLPAGTYTLGSAPPFVGRALVALTHESAVAPDVANVANYTGAAAGSIFVVANEQAANKPVVATGTVFFRRTAPQLFMTIGAPVGGFPIFDVLAYPHHAPRLDGGMGAHSL